MKIEKNIKIVLDVTELNSDVSVESLLQNNELFEQDLNERLADRINYLSSNDYRSGEVNEEIIIDENDTRVWVTGWIYF